MAGQPASYDDPDFRTEERVVRRRRLLAAIVTLTAFVAVAGGSAVGAVAVPTRTGPTRRPRSSSFAEVSSR